MRGILLAALCCACACSGSDGDVVPVGTDVAATPDPGGGGDLGPPVVDGAEDASTADSGGEDAEDITDVTDVIDVESPVEDANLDVALEDDVESNVGADVEEPGEAGGDVPALTCDGEGMTFLQYKQPSAEGTIMVSCGDVNGDCDPWEGDTACTEARPVLCLKWTGESAPAGETPWFAGTTDITAPVQGCALTSLAVANALCEETFGPDWRMAEFHDGGAGDAGAITPTGNTALAAYGSWTTSMRLWVFINDQPGGNCFPLPSTIPTNCCDPQPCQNGGPCVQGYCVANMAIPAAGGCLLPEHCPLGTTCEVPVPEMACTDGGWPTYGSCVPLGPGGMCPVYPGPVFGDCPTELGFMWTGKTCTPVTGCDCGEVCKAVFPTFDDCVAGCAPPICCASDAECGGSLACFQGHCVSPAPEGSCWSGEECLANEVCVGAYAAACGGGGGIGPKKKAPMPPKKCKIPPCPGTTVLDVAPGKCVVAPVCCTTSADCAEGETCAPTPYGSGTCQPEAQGTACWTSADCAAGEGCAFVMACPCEVGCTSHTGSCAPLPEVCCTSDGDCGEGELCSALPAGPWGGVVDVGQCVVAPSEGSCFSNAHCGAGEVCYGQGMWPCGVAGGTPPLGTCASAAGSCCGTDGSCPVGFQCVGQLGYEGVSCQAPPPAGACWVNADCAEGEFCQGATTGWGCGSPDVGAVPGTCTPQAGANCCISDSDCAEGTTCTAKAEPWPTDFQDATLGQCVTPPWEGGCYQLDDCPEGYACSGAPGWPCGKPAGPPGSCVMPGDLCCWKDQDCPSATHCVGETVTVPGQCSFHAEDGGCWDDGDCGDGETCSGAYVCSPCQPCIEGQEETPGVCVP